MSLIYFYFLRRLSLRPQTSGQGFVSRNRSGVRMHICACNDVSDISITVPTHDTARNAGLKRSPVPPRKATAPLLVWPAGVLLVALCSLLAFASPIAYAFGAKIPRRARTSSLKSAERRTMALFSTTDARDPTQKYRCRCSRGLQVCPCRHSPPFRSFRNPLCTHSAQRHRAAHA